MKSIRGESMGGRKQLKEDGVDARRKARQSRRDLREERKEKSEREVRRRRPLSLCVCLFQCSVSCSPGFPLLHSMLVCFGGCVWLSWKE